MLLQSAECSLRTGMFIGCVGLLDPEPLCEVAAITFAFLGFSLVIHINNNNNGALKVCKSVHFGWLRCRCAVGFE